MKPKTVRAKASKVDMTCPYCDKHAEACASPFTPRTVPEEEDMVMCIGCGRFAIAYRGRKGLALRQLNHEEGLELAGNRDAYKMWVTWKATVALRDHAGTIH